MKKTILFLFLTVMVPIFSYPAGKQLQFNDKAVIYSNDKDSFIFLKSGKIFGIHKKTPVSIIGTYKMKGKKIIASFEGIDGKKTRETFMIVNKNTLQFEDRLFRKEK